MLRTTAHILTGKIDEVFDPNWIDGQTVRTLPTADYDGLLTMEKVEVWEVIVEHGGGLGVYAAWLPYGECYIVTGPTGIVAEFNGLEANSRLESYLIARNIPYPKGGPA